MGSFVQRVTAEDIQKMSVKEIEQYLVKYGNRTYEEAYHNALKEFKDWFEITDYETIEYLGNGEHCIMDMGDIISEFARKQLQRLVDNDVKVMI